MPAAVVRAVVRRAIDADVGEIGGIRDGERRRFAVLSMMRAEVTMRLLPEKPRAGQHQDDRHDDENLHQGEASLPDALRFWRCGFMDC